MGRIRAVGDVLGMWVNIFESSPLTAIIPLLMAVLGFGSHHGGDRVPVLGLGDRARHPGRGQIQPLAGRDGALVRRDRRELYGKYLLAALPEILAGVRLGLIRGVKGVVIGQLLIAIIGVGFLFETYSRKFLMPEFWALVLIVFGFAYGLAETIRVFERRVGRYATAR